MLSFWPSSSPICHKMIRNKITFELINKLIVLIVDRTSIDLLWELSYEDIQKKHHISYQLRREKTRSSPNICPTKGHTTVANLGPASAPQGFADLLFWGNGQPGTWRSERVTLSLGDDSPAGGLICFCFVSGHSQSVVQFISGSSLILILDQVVFSRECVLFWLDVFWNIFYFSKEIDSTN